jgi:hypothetical protein
VRLAGLKRDAQRHALAQQMLLADNLAQSARAQTLGQRGVGGWNKTGHGTGALKLGMTCTNALI